MVPEEGGATGLFPGSRESVTILGHAPVAQLDRVLPSEGRGHRFDSCRARQISKAAAWRPFFIPAYSPSLLLRRCQAPHLARCARSRNTPSTAPDSVSLRRDGE